MHRQRIIYPYRPPLCLDMNGPHKHLLLQILYGADNLCRTLSLSSLVTGAY